MRECVPAFAEVLERQREANPNSNRTRRGVRLFDFLSRLEEEFFRRPLCAAGLRYETSSYRDDLEALVSFVDLNLSTDVHALVVDGNGEPADLRRRGHFWNASELNDVRVSVATYLYLTLIEPGVDESLLGHFVNGLADGDSIVTFNYDLVLDAELWRQRLWQPTDGYGITFPNLAAVTGYDFESSLRLLKLHGSLNWQRALPDPFPPALELRLRYDDGRPVFPGPPLDALDQLPFAYEGAHDAGGWMMPSYVKRFDLPEILNVWRQAFEALRCAEEIVVIGYSLPAADSAASVLLADGAAGKPLTLVDPNCAELCIRYERLVAGSSVSPVERLEQFLG